MSTSDGGRIGLELSRQLVDRRGLLITQLLRGVSVCAQGLRPCQILLRALERRFILSLLGL